MRHYLNEQKKSNSRDQQPGKEGQWGNPEGKKSLPSELFLHILGSVPLEDRLDIVFTSIPQACNLRERGPA